MSDDEETRDLFKDPALGNQDKAVSGSFGLGGSTVHAVRSITSFIRRNTLLRRDKSIPSFKGAKAIRLLMRQNKAEREASEIGDKCRIFQPLLRGDEYRLSRKNDLVAMLQSNSIFSSVSVCGV
jgi:hypothetical protein